MMMRKLNTLMLCLLGLASTAYAQPENPEPGKCYVRCITPDVWQEEEVRILEKPGHKELKVVPAEYKTMTEKVMVKPASKKYVYVPAKYETVTEEISLKESFGKIAIVPAAFADDTEEVITRPAYASYEYQRAMENCPQDSDCLVLCYVAHPEEKRSVATQKLMSDATFTKTSTGGRTITITKEVEVSPARVDEVDIPAEYREIEKQVLVKDETVEEIVVEPVYRTEKVRKLVEKGGVAVWEEIDCKLADYNLLPIFYEFGSARLTAASKTVIDEKLLSLMQQKKNIKVELASHTDSRGGASANQDLSQRRAQSVVDYLVSKGIVRGRLIAKGYGETRLTNRCKDGVDCSEAEHQANRRTEFRVISE